MANSLIFKNAEAAKDAIMDSQKKEIAALYEKWADEIGEKAKYFAKKTTASSVVSERQMKELQKMLKATGQQVSNEVHSKIKTNMYTIADAVVADNVKWLESFGFSAEGLNAAFNFVPDAVVRNLITGQIYDSGWSLSSRIWGDNEQTMKDAYQIMAKGLAENKPVYEIAKELENYVRPSAKKSWNHVLAMKNTKTGRIEYKRIYKKQVDYSAQRLARTLAQHSYQQSFLAVTQKNPFITDYIWHSNGSRVCDLCASRDGKHFKKDELPMDHPNGMCVMEPVVVKDMVDQLADWFNSPDGTYPEIDAFAGNFGYEASKASDVKTALDFVNKYGLSTKSPNAWFNSLTPIQKAEAKMLKEQSGLTWNDWYEKNVHSTGDPNLDFAKKYGTSTKSPNAWFNSLSAAQKAEAKLLKEKTGLTWNDWYAKYVYSGTSDAVKKTQMVKAFSSIQEKYLAPYGFSPDNMPTSFDDWSHKISHSQAGEILKSMGTSWSDPHPYQQLMKYYNANLTKSNFVSQVAKTTKATTKAATAAKAAKTTSQVDASFDAAQWYSSLKKNNLREFNGWTNDWLSSITATEKNGVVVYTGSAYNDMNQFLRGQRSTTRYQSEIDACRKALEKAKLPRETIVRRGSGYNMLNDLGIGQVTKGNKNQFIGSVVVDKGFTSTSPAPGGGFGGSIEYVIKLPQGCQAMYVDSISRHKGEEELLINCGGKYVVEDIEVNDWGQVSKIYMTLINLK